MQPDQHETWIDQVERGEYKIEEGWDGIKAGFLQRPGAGQVIVASGNTLKCHILGGTSRGPANQWWMLLAQVASAGMWNIPFVD